MQQQLDIHPHGLQGGRSFCICRDLPQPHPFLQTAFGEHMLEDMKTSLTANELRPNDGHAMNIGRMHH